jgi:Kef-type K+ transport system membrane component KefB
MQSNVWLIASAWMALAVLASLISIRVAVSVALIQVAKSEAVLTAYLVGLVIAGVFVRDRLLMDRMRAIAFAMLTPFYFIKAGLFVSLPAVASGVWLILALLGVKILAKVIGVWPLTRVFRFGRRDGAYTMLLMSTGLTFGTIPALFGR